MLEFEAAELTNVGRKTGLADRQWGTLSLVLNDTATDHRRVVELNVLLPSGPDITMRDWADAAHSDAQAALSAALELLQKSALRDLMEKQQTAAT